MKKTDNSSYNRIILFLKQNPHIDKEEKRMLISYATQLLKDGVENYQTEDISDILCDLQYVNEILKLQNETTVSFKRIQKIVDIFLMITDFYNSKEISLEEISYQLDKLYFDMDLQVRKKSGLSYNLENNKVIRK